MKKLILPLLIVLLGVGGGGAAGFFLKPPPAEVALDENGEPLHDCPAPAVPVKAQDAEVPDADSPEYVKLNNQFVIPIMKSGQVSALIIVALTIETNAADRSVVYEREPKLRDLFNDVFFYHANSGGFDGVFTDIVKMERLRMGLHEAATAVLGPSVQAVLITDIVRQET